LCADVLDRTVTVSAPDEVEIACPTLETYPAAVLREILIALWKRSNWPQQEMGFDQWNRLAEMLRQTEGQHVLPGNILATRQGRKLVLKRPR